MDPELSDATPVQLNRPARYSRVAFTPNQQSGEQLVPMPNVPRAIRIMVTKRYAIARTAVAAATADTSLKVGGHAFQESMPQSKQEKPASCSTTR